MRWFLILTTIFFSAVAGSGDSSAYRLYAGQWNNRAASTNGHLVAKVFQSEDGNWISLFTGEFQGQAFEYEIVMDVKDPKDGKSDKKKIRGRANVDGVSYLWSGSMSEKTFTGRYNSSTAKGDFRLSRKR